MEILKKSFTSNDYRTLKVIVFGEFAKAASNMNVGTVIGVVGPRPLDQSYNNGVSVSIDKEG